jgi:hypothetical protein
MTDTVQLRHDLPDGSSHIDWLIDLDPVREGSLATFRLERRVDDLCAGEVLTAERLADHRRLYLDYEGPVSDGRGVVRRLASGRIEALQTLGDLWALVVCWAPADEPTALWQRLCMCRKGTGWVVQALSMRT